MLDKTKKHVDSVTGMETTGHEWDGLRELNTPLPKWWLYIFYVTIVWSIGYWIVYPSWPLVSSYTGGLFGWHSREAVIADLAELKAQRGEMQDRIAAAPVADILNDQQMLTFARAQGRTAFADNCAPCHGAGGGGAKGYPNLNDDEWLWGGNPAQIEQTIRYGVRGAHEQSRTGASMPAFGRDRILPPADLNQVADFVLSLGKLPVDPKADLARGAKIYADNCASCHGAEGRGNRELGAPNLTDAIWLYGASKPAILESINVGRGASMPAWIGRLDDATIKALTVYVHSLGGGEK